jgi:spore maturation protein CgeB
MRFVIFAHSLVSDWNHGNAHFLRGIATELTSRGHNVAVLEPLDSWSRRNLLLEGGTQAIADFESAYPLTRGRYYDAQSFDPADVLNEADVVIVHEWNSHDLVRRIGEHHAHHPHYRLFFHDTHHRSATDPSAMSAYQLQHYDGVLAYGNIIRDLYLQNGWARSAWTWHEAADTRVFRPMPQEEKAGDLVWIGNWGDEERTLELREFLIEPVRALKLRAKVYGVRYPQHALDELQSAGIEYGGWLPNYLAPKVFATYRVTVHVPRRPYASALPGIPTIRPFEALACGVPLISAPWSDCEHLFQPGKDYLRARNGEQMIEQLRFILSETKPAQSAANSLIASGLESIHQRHTCVHRVNELLDLVSGAIN